MAGASEAGSVIKTKFSFRKKDNKRQNDFCIGGEIWKKVPNTDFAYYSTHGRFSSSKDLGFPGNGCILCSEEEIKKDKANTKLIESLAMINHSLGNDYVSIKYFKELYKKS